MRRPDGRWFAAVGLALLGVLGIWLVGLERVELRTGLASEQTRETSLWVAEDGYYLWVEARDSELAWYDALLADPLVEVRRYGRVERYRAEPMPAEALRVERLYRKKYGVAHALLALLQDRTRVIPIRLARLPDPGTRA